MNDFMNRLTTLTPEKRRLLEAKLKDAKLCLEKLDEHTSKWTITPVSSQEHYPLSTAQTGMYILDRFHPGANFNMPLAYLVEGPLEKEKVETIFRNLIERHEALRTTFGVHNGEPVQLIHPRVDFHPKYMEASEEQLPGLLSGFFRPFDLLSPPLIRVGLVRLSDEKHLLLIDMHHLIADGYSLNLLMKEFLQLYKGESLPGLRIQYKDYAVWQQDFLISENFSVQEKYWRERFADGIPALDLPLDFPRSLIGKSTPGEVKTILSAADGKKLQQLALSNKASLHMVVFAIYALFLAKYSGQSEVVIDSISAGRHIRDVENIPGMFLKVIPIKFHLDAQQTFHQFLGKVRQWILSDHEHQDYPFERLKESTSSAKKKNTLSFISYTQFNFHNENEFSGNVEIGPLTFIPYPLHLDVTEEMQLDLALDVTPQIEQLDLHWHYNSSLFTPGTIARMVGHFHHLVREIIGEPDRKLCHIPLCTSEEKERILSGFNLSPTHYVEDRTIDALFQIQAERTPDNMAVISETRSLTYRELDTQSNQLAGWLRLKGVRPNQLVGVMVDRSPEMILAILAVLKAGAAYLPVDPGYPRERIRYILEDSAAGLLLTQSHLETRDFFGEIILLDYAEDWKNAGIVPENGANADDPAYLLYTSGSTGKPKGVLVEHQNVLAYVRAFLGEFPLGPDDVVLQQASYSFDVFVEEVYPVLFSGGTLVMPEREKILDPQLLHGVLTKYRVTLVSCTPLLLNELNKLALVPSIHTYISGGDVLKEEHISNLRHHAKVYNTYGPTETTVCATYYRCDRELPVNIPIGKPIPGYQVYIVDRDVNLLPVGIPGEIIIGGAGLSRGYLNRPDITAEKFVPNPFDPVTSVGANHDSPLRAGRLYRTGDRGRWLPDGNIEFRGRFDEQVKIRGYRIELGEIENLLVKHGAVREAVVIDQEDPEGEKFLCAYYVPDGEVLITELKEHLARELPSHMIPACFVPLPGGLPVTSHGKVDRRALPEPEIHSGVAAFYVPPTNDTEKELVRIWQEVLRHEPIGIDDNFFEIGGNSLKAVLLVAKIKKAFHKEIVLNDLFQAQTIRTLAELLSVSRDENVSVIEPVPAPGPYPASSVQKRLHALQAYDPGCINYNIPLFFMLEKTLAKTRVESSLKELLIRHEALRTSFVMNGETLMQVVHPDVICPVEYLEATEETLPDMAASFVRPFDLGQAPLLRVGMISLKHGKMLLLFDMHHIISDEATVNILMREFIDLYEGRNLPPLRIQYKDFTAWQNRLMASERFKKQEEYWLHSLAGEIPVLDLPLDFPRPVVQSFEGGREALELSGEFTGQLRHLTAGSNTTSFMVFLAAYKVLLANCACQEEIIVGIPVVGRTHADLEHVVGMFVNTLVLKTRPSGQKTFRCFLEEVRAQVVGAFDHQDYPFEMLLENLNPPRLPGRNPLFDSLFVYRDAKDDQGLQGAGITPYRFDQPISKVDLSLYVVETRDGLRLELEFCQALFKRETVERFLHRYVEYLRTVVDNPEVKLNAISAATVGTREEIQMDEVVFNF